MSADSEETRGEPVRPVIDDELVDRLMAQVDAEGLELLGPEGVLTELTSRILSRGLEVEMADHLGYEKGDPAGWGSGNNRNGNYPKTIQTDAGTVGVGMPRDGQVEDLEHGIAGGEMSSGFGDLAELIVQRFDGVGGVDDLADRGFEGEERGEPFPVPSPQVDDGRILVSPLDVKVVEGIGAAASAVGAW